MAACRPSDGDGIRRRVKNGGHTPCYLALQILVLLNIGGTSGSYPPPAGMPSPVLWGDEETVRERFGDGVADLRITKRMYPVRYPFSPAEVVEFFRVYYGPTNSAFATLASEPEKLAALRRDLEAHWRDHNTAQDGGTTIEAEYLEVVAVKA